MAHQPVGDSQTITTSATSARIQFAVQTDSEINEEDKLIAAEREAGLIPPTEQEMQIAQMAMDAEQKTQPSKPKSEVEPDIDTESVEAPESPKGGQI